MKYNTLQIIWHDKEPVFAVDFEPSGKSRLATSGGDSKVRIWKMIKDEEGLPSVEYLASLTRHTSPVNVVRWSPRNSLLATASDDGTIMIWEETEHVSKTTALESDEDAKETWKMHAVLRGAPSDVYDLAWSPCGNWLISGSVDSTARIWSVKESKSIQVLTDHTNYVQGVAWDPLGEFIATQSSDRSVNVYKYEVKKNMFVLSKFSKMAKLPYPTIPPPNEERSKKDFRQYHDENLHSFFRRLSFTSDGAFLLTPAGLYRDEGVEANKNAGTNTVYMYARNLLNKIPVAHLPGFKKPAVAICPNPVRFELNGVPSTFNLPYRTIFAVVSQDAVTIYDTQTLTALVSCSGLHYATHTDAAWSSDGKTLIVSSTDGYCTIFDFDEADLGKAIPMIQSVPQPMEDFSTPPDTPQLQNDDMDVQIIEKPVVPVEPIVVASNVQGDGKKKRIAPTFLQGL